MLATELFLHFVRPLNRSGIRYVIGGSVAATFYGEPRFTRDVDVMVFLNEPGIRKLPELFPATECYLPPIEVIMAEVARGSRRQFNIIHLDTTFKADIYPTGRDEFNAWAFRNERTVTYEEEPLVLAPPEHVIVRKLEFFREGGSDKHLRDIRFILAATPVQHEFVEREVSLRNLDAQWRRILDDDSVPK